MLSLAPSNETIEPGCHESKKRHRRIPREDPDNRTDEED